LELSNLVDIVLDILDHSWSSILDKVVHDMDGLSNPSPLFRLGLEFVPKMFHDYLVILPEGKIINLDKCTYQLYVWSARTYNFVFDIFHGSLDVLSFRMIL
jgi:hypothetical protein